jgi:hypothetical protein
VTPLDTAIAVSDLYHRAEVITRNLNLNMSGISNHPLDVNFAGAKGGFGFRPRALKCIFDLVWRGDHPQSTTAATADRFEKHRSIRRQSLEELSRLVEVD